MSRGRSMDRPPAAEGWGMLMAKKTRTLTGPDGERIQVTAGTSRVHRSHWAIRLHPEVFEVCDRGDTRTQRVSRPEPATVRVGAAGTAAGRMRCRTVRDRAGGWREALAFRPGDSRRVHASNRPLMRLEGEAGSSSLTRYLDVHWARVGSP